MRTIIISLFLSVAFSAACSAQSNAPLVADSVVWYQYIGGKPDMDHVLAQKRVLQSFGMKVETVFGGCIGPFEQEYALYEQKNRDATNMLQQKLGPDWPERLSQLVEAELAVPGE